MRQDAMIFIFLVLRFKPAFSLSSVTFIKRLFSSSSLSAIKVVSSAYLRLLIFLQAVLIPAWASSSPVFHMMYSACKLNKQHDNIQPLYTPFPALNQSVVSCPVLTAASCPLFRFLRWQVRWSDIPVSLRIFQFVVICTIKMALVQSMKQMFFGIPLLFLWSSRCWQFDLWFLNPACTSGSSQFMYCWSLAWRILSVLLLACEVNAVVQ